MLDRLAIEAAEFFTYWNMVFLLIAMWKTLAMTALGCGLGFVLGFILVYLRKSRGRALIPVRFVMITYVEVIRRTPFLVLLFIVLFSLKAFGIELSLFATALATIVMVATAFIGEIIRAGLESVHQNQWDAAEVLNFSRIETLRMVIVPQAWKVIIPPAFAFFVMFIKDSALASQLGVVELTMASKLLNFRGFSALFVFSFCLLLYFILSYPLTRLGWWMEKKLESSRTH